ncbi:hypothetical protein HZI73_00020 [Vallitalea pronyensis]|uniref:DUF3298 domain-containing protein n=1 Tax=Vallitalea pronyensis TaxID=1348613 RepID=A0A8J8MG12_9FIRM|nr:hypothetical protein [Vallitalea pronyensis]QUI20791.1 hypothetical protein HZI73_00020 [Vallitalea pronyensis]
MKKNKNFNYMIIIVAILLLAILTYNVYTSKSVSVLGSGKMTIQIERVDDSIKSESGEILAYIYYDKPIIQDIEWANKINSFYEGEMEGWLNGSNRLTHYQEGWLQKFKNITSENCESLGDDVIAEQPFLYTIDSKVMMLNKNYLSIRQIATVQTAGKPIRYYYGSTFDLSTGELIPIDTFVDIKADDFRNTLAEFLSDNILAYNHNVTPEELKGVYGANSEGNYQIEYDNETMDLSYEYYYDGNDYYIILNHCTLIDQGIIMKWNGKLGEAFNSQIISYNREQDGSYKVKEY